MIFPLLAVRVTGELTAVDEDGSDRFFELRDDTGSVRLGAPRAILESSWATIARLRKGHRVTVVGMVGLPSANGAVTLWVDAVASAGWHRRRPRWIPTPDHLRERFQPALMGAMDGLISGEGVLWAAALQTKSTTTLKIALASALVAAISMGFSEAASDTGELTGRGRPLVRGLATALATLIGGAAPALGLLLPTLAQGLVAAGAIVAVEILLIAWLRRWAFGVGFMQSTGMVALFSVVAVAVAVAFDAS